MDLKGHEIICDVFKQSGIEATVEPVPIEGEHAEFVSVNTATDVVPAVVLNTLAKAQLLEPSGMIAIKAVMRHGPQLRPLFGQPGSVTFEDTHNRY